MTKNHPMSDALFERARRVMPGGNTRTSLFIEPHPPYAARGLGCHLVDADGVERLDFINNFSSAILGHGHPAVVAAIREQAGFLTSVGLPTRHEVELAELLCDRIASVERIRFCNSGTEALMLACKAARAFTNRPKIAKIEGAYHGLYDPVEVSQNSSATDWGPSHAPNSVALSRGTPSGILADTIVLPLHDLEASRALIRNHAADLAAVLVDPVVSRLGMIRVPVEYVKMLREETRLSGSVLVFDEVYSFRLSYGGAQELWGIQPDLTALGKIIGGGLPVGALGGLREIMDVFDPTGGKPLVAHGGTFNANPMTMRAGIAMMEQLGRPAIARLNALGDTAMLGLRKAIDRTGITAQVNGMGSAFAITMCREPMNGLRDYPASATVRYLLDRFHKEMFDAGVMLTPQGVFTLSTPMTEADIEFMLSCADRCFEKLVADRSEHAAGDLVAQPQADRV